LNRELQLQKYVVTDKTVVVIDEQGKHPDIQKLVRLVQERGGKVVFTAEKIREQATQEIKAERQQEWQKEKQNREVVKEVQTLIQTGRDEAEKIKHDLAREALRERRQKEREEPSSQKETHGHRIRLRHDLK